MAYDTRPRGMYYEDFEVGETYSTPARTITATDIVNFACLSGDFNDPHTNWEYCKGTDFGEPIAHGPLVYAIAGGLFYASGITQGTVIALLGIDNWRMHNPAKAGTTIHMELTVQEKRVTSKGDRGIVRLDRKIVGADDTLLQRQDATLMFWCRPAGDGEG
jgi:acyl dehydratase